jgi:hypothetical protein
MRLLKENRIHIEIFGPPSRERRKGAWPSPDQNDGRFNRRTGCVKGERR